jgi:hypothetical protein
VQKYEHSLGSNFEGSSISRRAAFTRGAVKISVGAEGESSVGEPALGSIEVVSNSDPPRRTNFENCSCAVSSSVFGCGLDVVYRFPSRPCAINPALLGCSGSLLWVPKLYRTVNYAWRRRSKKVRYKTKGPST